MVKREYQSKYTDDGKCGEAQYLVDISLERIAKREKEVLTKRYWKNPKWAKHFKRQIVAANALLKEFTCKQIVDALNTPRGKNIFSLGLKKPISELIANSPNWKSVAVADEEIFVQDDWDTDGNISYHGESLPANKKRSTWEELQ